jgi:predicted Fe-Mo cluster-binding NifX family protein
LAIRLQLTVKTRKKMKIAISSTGKDFNAQIDPRFGRCSHLAIVETSTMEIQVFDNENINLNSGAGIQTAGFAASKGIEAVLTGNCGPKAMQVFNEAGIKVFPGQTGTVKEAVERLKNDLITPTSEANVPEKQGFQPQSTPGMGTGGGMGRCQGGMGRCGGGGGRGMGGGGGRGMGGGGGGRRQ